MNETTWQPEFFALSESRDFYKVINYSRLLPWWLSDFGDSFCEFSQKLSLQFYKPIKQVLMVVTNSVDWSVDKKLLSSRKTKKFLQWID